MALGMLVFMVDFTLLRPTLYPSRFHYRYYFTKKIELLVFSLKNVFFSNWKKVRNFFPSIDLREVLLQ